AKFALAKHGGSLIRLGEILQQPRVAQLARKSGVQLAASWKLTYPGAEAPPFFLPDIEYITRRCIFWGRAGTSPNEETNPPPHQLCFGVSYGFIHWRKPVPEVFAWLKRTPGAEVKQHGEFSYVELLTGLLGPEKICVCRIDDQTLLW